MATIIPEIIILFFMIVGHLIFNFIKKKEEERLAVNSEFTVKSSKGILLFFGLWMLLCLVAIITVITVNLPLNKTDSRAVIISEIIIFVFFLIGALGFFNSKCDYLIVKEDGITVNSLFKRARFIKYSDITYVNFASGIGCFDFNKKLIFAVDNYHFGLDKLYSFLLNKGCKELPKPFTTRK